jgi:hypothetical protein
MLQDVSVAPTLASDSSPPSLLCGWRADRLGAAWVDVTGGVDQASAPSLVRVLDRALACAPLVMLDLRAAVLLDGAGGRVIREAAALAQGQGHELVVVQGLDQPDVSLALADAPDVRACYLDAGEPSIQALLQLARPPARW